MRFIIEKYNFLRNFIIYYLIKGEEKEVYFFRVFSILLWFNLVSILVFSEINIFRMINPLKFLSPPASDTRVVGELYFPRVEDLYYMDSIDPSDQIIVVHQKIDLFPVKGDQDVIDQIYNIFQILYGGSEGLKGKKLTGSINDIKMVWLTSGNAVVHYSNSEITPEEKRVIFICLEKSVIKNIPSVKGLVIVE